MNNYSLFLQMLQVSIKLNLNDRRGKMIPTPSGLGLEVIRKLENFSRSETTGGGASMVEPEQISRERLSIHVFVISISTKMHSVAYLFCDGVILRIRFSYYNNRTVLAMIEVGDVTN